MVDRNIAKGFFLCKGGCGVEVFWFKIFTVFDFGRFIPVLVAFVHTEGMSWGTQSLVKL